MKHPRREEWVPFVFGEAEAEQRQQLEEHLKQCQECSAEIARWQHSLGRLDAWKVPPRQKMRRGAVQPLAWAAAAVLMLGIGLAAGQWGAHAARSGMRAEISRLEGQMAELKKQTAAALTMKVAVADSATKQLQTALESLRTAREEDREHLLALVEELESKQDAALVSLRRDLETVASHADDELQAARNRLMELSSVQAPAETIGLPVDGE
jgi:hypothetical protein